ncbi:MAG: glycosyltransferase family 4 protein [Gemmatimonadaceae bacterium]
MRISILCGGSRVFGTEVVALTLAAGLKARGHDVFMLCSGWNNGEFPRRLTSAGIPFETIFLGRISKSLHPREIWYTIDALRHVPGARRQLRDHFRSFNPDIVLVYIRDWMILALPTLRGYSTIFHVHEKPEPSRSNKRAYPALSKTLAAMVAASNHIARGLEQVGVAASKIKVIQNGLSFGPIPADTVAAPKRPPTVGIIGQIGEWKGHDDMLVALVDLRERGILFACSIFGAGEDSYIRALKKKAEAAGIADAITWHGYESRLDVMYGSIDVCAVPSRFEEPFGLVAVEAASRGIPVVATSHGGLSEIVVDGTTGFLIPPRSPKQLADRLAALLQDDALRKSLGHAAMVRARRLFAADRMVSDFENFCAAIVNGAAAQPR